MSGASGSIDVTSVSVVGLGYVGLTVAAVLASRGFRVTGIDVDRERVSAVSSGRCPIHEPGLDRLVRRSVSRGTLAATTDYTAVRETSVTFVTVGTPSNSDGSIDLRYVREASRSIGEALRGKPDGHLVVVKSTVVPGTTGKVVVPTLESSSGKRVGEGLFVCVNPEFLREGSAVRDMLEPDRIVLGDAGDGSSDLLLELYRRLYRRRMPPVLKTNYVNAELIKYANNVFLAARVSLINEFANLCQLIPGADVKVVAEGIGLDERIGPHFLRAGIGFGGSCFPKDIRAIVALSRELGHDPRITRAVYEVNELQPSVVVRTAEELLGDLMGKRVAVLGLAFKPNTDDVRESPALKLVRLFAQRGAEVRAYDPAAGENARRELGDTAEVVGSVEECLEGADLCVLATEWDQFRSLRPEDFASLMREPALIDGRRVYDPKEFSGKVRFRAIGLGPADG
ncbi:MAG: UDP-glucose/GDP-mannose dehydrogenase family protein [Nitrososphaerota archaeon]|nr:UDP-glucose/GDP-mannose dehydrogenase family protein [Nitrososphaerota archaeon]